MKTEALIIFPPQWPPISPYSALPMLRARLQKEGFPTRVLDLNCRAYDAVLSEGYLRGLRLPDAFPPGDPRHSFRWLLTVRDELSGRIEAAKAILRNPESFFDAQQYLYAENTLRYSLLLISLSFWPQQISLDSLDFGMPSSDLFSASQLERAFGSFIFEDVLDRILAAECSDPRGVIGFSVHTKAQLFFALRIIRRQFRRKSRHVHVTLG